MSDIALKRFTVGDAGMPVFDIALNGGDLVADGGLESSVLLSLFLNRRADDDDELPIGVTDRGGWWPVAFDSDLGEIGSRLWLLYGKAITKDVLRDFKAYSEEALKWLVREQIATRVRVVVERIDTYVVRMRVDIAMNADRVWSNTWTVTLQQEM